MTTSGDDPSGLRRLEDLLTAGTAVTSVTHDSRTVAPGAVYACLRGEHHDGHEFAAHAVRAGATVLLTDHLIDIETLAPGSEVSQIVVDDTRLRLGPIAARVVGDPSSALTTVGVTGTNGKTTVAAMTKVIFEATGRRCGVIGTLYGPRTTPEAPELQDTLRSFVDDGCQAAVLEVSSHALAMHRVDGTRFDALIFTNLGHDHLDLHGSQEEYFRAKARLFDASFSPLAVINVDDPHGRLLADTVGGPGLRVVEYSVTDVTDLRVSAISHGYSWRGIDVTVPIGGDFNVANSIAALTTAVELGLDAETAAEGLAALPIVPGRFEPVDTAASRALGISVVVDYAHTPDGLGGVLAAARSGTSSTGSLVVVFGCGGDRDRAKRAEMGAEAARGADRVIITTDNPRSEVPEDIIADVVAGIDGAARARVSTITDRAEAIGEAITAARPGDVVVIAGKGHEQTQEFADRIIEFDDRAVAREFLEAAS